MFTLVAKLLFNVQFLVFHAKYTTQLGILATFKLKQQRCIDYDISQSNNDSLKCVRWSLERVEEKESLSVEVKRPHHLSHNAMGPKGRARQGRAGQGISNIAISSEDEGRVG